MLELVNYTFIRATAIINIQTSSRPTNIIEKQKKMQ